MLSLRRPIPLPSSLVNILSATAPAAAAAVEHELHIRPARHAREPARLRLRPSRRRPHPAEDSDAALEVQHLPAQPTYRPRPQT
jgi:hypothetical protein